MQHNVRFYWYYYFSQLNKIDQQKTVIEAKDSTKKEVAKDHSSHHSSPFY